MDWSFWFRSGLNVELGISMKPQVVVRLGTNNRLLLGNQARISLLETYI